MTPGGGLVATPIHACRANYEAFFSHAVAFTKYGSDRAISYTRVHSQVSLARRVAVDGH